jgi:photosystem II stability/assembly factor-like uncharacterized protein
MARLYAATGDGIARLDEAGEGWTLSLSLSGSGAQCLALDPADPETLYAGLREGGVHRSLDGGRTWIDCKLPEPAVFSLAVSAANGAVYAGTEPITWSVTVDPDDPDCWYVSASTGPYAAHGRGDPQARIYRRRDGEPWQPLAGGLPEPLPAMPYALLAADGRLFAGLADGQIWESRDRGDSWAAPRLEGERIGALFALAGS